MGHRIPRTTARGVLGVTVPRGPGTPGVAPRWSELPRRRLRAPSGEAPVLSAEERPELPECTGPAGGPPGLWARVAGYHSSMLLDGVDALTPRSSSRDAWTKHVSLLSPALSP